MSFLKDFKEDLAQAVNELIAEEPVEEPEADRAGKAVVKEGAQPEIGDSDVVSALAGSDLINNFRSDGGAGPKTAEADIKENEHVTEYMAEEETKTMEENIIGETVMEENFMEETVMEEAVVEETVNEPQNEPEDLPSDEVAEITKGTAITGNIVSDGSINVYGKIVGDVSCKGKLIITGIVKGTSQAGEIFANNSRIEGDVKSTGSVKIGNGSVIVGNVYATSAVIGGAIKGDIDVHGPVIIDATAVIQGNIKSRSVQINNGAAIEGFCSQCYADIDYKALFEDTFGDD